MEERINCEVCHSKLKQIQETAQYYCDQPAAKCYNSLKVIYSG